MVILKLELKIQTEGMATLQKSRALEQFRSSPINC